MLVHRLFQPLQASDELIDVPRKYAQLARATPRADYVDVVAVANLTSRLGTAHPLANVDLPFVLIDRERPARYRVSAVRNDHRNGTRDAAEALLDLGHRRIALVTGPLEISPVRERIAGLREAVAARVTEETEVFRPIIRDANIKLE